MSNVQASHGLLLRLKMFQMYVYYKPFNRHSPCNARDGLNLFIHPREVKNTFQVLETGDSPDPMCISGFYNRVVPLSAMVRQFQNNVALQPLRYATTNSFIESLRFECPRSLHLLSG